MKALQLRSASNCCPSHPTTTSTHTVAVVVAAWENEGRSPHKCVVRGMKRCCAGVRSMLLYQKSPCEKIKGTTDSCKMHAQAAQLAASNHIAWVGGLEVVATGWAQILLVVVKGGKAQQTDSA